MARPSVLPVGISPAGLFRKRSSSCSPDIVRNCFRSGLIGIGLRCGFFDWDLEGLEKFDQRLLIGVGKIGAEIMAFVFDEIRSVIYLQQIRDQLAELGCGSFRR